MDELSAVAADYWSARREFRQAAELAGCEIETHEFAAKGPLGDDLTLDVAIAGPANAWHTVIVSSGLHGVEAFLGSAAQVLWLARQPVRALTRLPHRLVFLHALNPYGFAWSRRVDADNIDCNRNFLLPGEAFTGASDGYHRLNKLLNPSSPARTGDDWSFFLNAVTLVVRSGWGPLQQAVAAGQYAYPEGLFYGGRGVSETQQIVERHWSRWVGAATHVEHIDFHSGLGKWGECRLLSDTQLTPHHVEYWSRRLGSLVYAPSAGSSVEYQARGAWGAWCAERLRDRHYVYFCAEFGTYHPLRIVRGLRAENRAHFWSPLDDPTYWQTKATLRELFCPANEQWRISTLQTTQQLIDNASRPLDSPNGR